MKVKENKNVTRATNKLKKSKHKLKLQNLNLQHDLHVTSQK